MNQNLRFFQLITVFSLVFFTASTYSQSKVKYQIGTIPNIQRFDTLTSYEIRLDTLLYNYNIEKLDQELEGFSQEQKQKYKADHDINLQRYNYNRSRYFMQLLVNNKKSNNTFFTDKDTLTTQCSCYLKGDTIRVNMGIWLFGGWAFSIDVTKNYFTSSYSESTHERAAFKKQLTDTVLVDAISVENQEQMLILNKKPSFKIGESLIGHLTFKTKDYYRTSDYVSNMANDFYNPANMDTLNTTGTLYFKCTLRAMELGDE